MAAGVDKTITDARVGLKRLRNVAIALNMGALTVALAAYVARADLRGIQTAQRELNHLMMIPDEWHNTQNEERAEDS